MRINEFFVDPVPASCLVDAMRRLNARRIKKRDAEQQLFETTIDGFEHLFPVDFGIGRSASSIRDAVIEDLYDDHYLGSVKNERR